MWAFGANCDKTARDLQAMTSERAACLDLSTSIIFRRASQQIRLVPVLHLGIFWQVDVVPPQALIAPVFPQSII